MESSEARRNAIKGVNKAVSHGKKSDFFFWQWKGGVWELRRENSSILLDGSDLQTKKSVKEFPDGAVA